MGVMRKGTAGMSWLPQDHADAVLVARMWRAPDSTRGPGGPSVVAIRRDGVHDITASVPTISGLLEADDPAALVRGLRGERFASLEEADRAIQPRASAAPGFRWLAPCDLQVIKAAGVTFAASLLERVIEEQAHGDAARAEEVRRSVAAVLGGPLATIRPGSESARQLKDLLIGQGLWSQYLEVGIGPDAEIFTKAPVLSAVGPGSEIGIHPQSTWNNPEPEVVLAVDSRGRIKAATLGNDVNLRDFEGRSALLLSRAKDNNASCAIGPCLRLFDRSFGLEQLRNLTVRLEIRGDDGFMLRDTCPLSEISRDPVELVQQTINANHQYPDGFMLFLGTMFAPVQDRHEPGGGFTHRLGDVVEISTPALGALVNIVNLSDRIAPWTFGIGDLYANLAARGLCRLQEQQHAAA
jgi:fumarylacetoacetate (FAA) hydrolase family protein